MFILIFNAYHRMIADEDYTNLWRVPMSIDRPRQAKDKSGASCLAADVALNADWFKVSCFFCCGSISIVYLSLILFLSHGFLI